MQQVFLEAIDLSDLVDLESFSGWYVIWTVMVIKTREFLKIQIFFSYGAIIRCPLTYACLPSTQKHPNNRMFPHMTFELWRTFCLTKLWWGSSKLSFEIGFNLGPNPVFDLLPSALVKILLCQLIESCLTLDIWSPLIYDQISHHLPLACLQQEYF